MGSLSGFRQAALSATDNLLGSWIDELRETGAWDETVLIFTSDHGMDWSLPHNRVQPREAESVLNGGAAMVYVPEGGDIAQVAQTNADQDGVEFVATRDGIGGFPSLEEIGIDNPNTGEVVLFAEPGWAVHPRGRGEPGSGQPRPLGHPAPDALCHRRPSRRRPGAPERARGAGLRPGAPPRRAGG